MYTSFSLLGICWLGCIGAVRIQPRLSGYLTQTIQNTVTGHALFTIPLFITENTNQDVVVSDTGRVVVTDRGGRLRFSYTGPPSGSQSLH